MDSHAAQFLDKPALKFLNHAFLVTIPIPKHVFNDNYPINPKTFGERLRKARMDAGLQIKELAAMVGVTEDTVIN